MIPLLLLLAVGGLMEAARGFTTAFPTAGTELAFGYLLLSAFFMGRLAARVGLPRLTGYLLAGAISGPYVLELVTRSMSHSLSIVNGTATCILGLTAGAELNLKRIRPLFGTLRAITVLAILSAMIVLAGALWLLRPWLPVFDSLTTTQALAVCGLLGVALSAQSPAVAMALLSETRAEGPLSQLVLAVVVVADLVVVLVYSLVGPLASATLGQGVDIPEAALSVGWELIGSVAFGAAIGMLIGLFLRFVREGSSLFALLVCVVVAAAAPILHLDPLLVMLGAGIWLENFSKADASDLLHGFEAAELPVYLVFFALSGMLLEPEAIASIALPVGVIALVRGAVFFVGTRAATSLTHAEPVVKRYGWTGLLPQAGLSLAIVQSLRNNFPSIAGPASLLVLGVLAVNQILSPVLLRIALVRSGEAGKKASTDFAANG